MHKAPLLRLLLLFFCVPLIVGCEGCRKDEQAKEDKDKKQAPLQDFSSAGKPLAFPADGNSMASFLKPGHWTTASQSLKSNKIDIRGELISDATVFHNNFTEGRGRTKERESLKTHRPVVLPKGQMRRFEFRLLPPYPIGMEGRTISIGSRFVSSGRSTFFDTGKHPFNLLSASQYFFVVLTKRPERFARLQVASWVEPPRSDAMFDNEKQPPNYQVVIPKTKNVLALPETMLDLTSTAYILWDDLPPEALTPSQMTALADWIRFGGQLIVNGPVASDAIANTALADVLPLKPTGNIELDPDAAAAMLENWKVKSDSSTTAKIETMRNQPSRIAVDGHLIEGSIEIKDTENLVLARQIGQGRVVQPRFDVTANWLQDWDSYDSFFNGVVMHRAPRRIEEIDTKIYGHTYPNQNKKNADASMNTRLRITARDANLTLTADSKALAVKQANAADKFVYNDPHSGVGGWTDSSDAMQKLKEVLSSESGIDIPDASLVGRWLGYYLLILVPVNYLVFRLMRRLEYAWLAVPLIALGGAIFVAQAARLDIGFARSRTELALLELQPDYQRGHLSRVMVIYNSLKTRYELQFKTADGIATPVTAGDAEDLCTFNTDYKEGPSLSNLSVNSNKSRVVHTEQVVDVGGSVRFENGRLINETNQSFDDVFVIDKDAEGAARVAVVGLSEAQSIASLDFREYTGLPISDELPMQTGQIMQKFASPLVMPPDSMRMVARIDTSMEGLTMVPDVSQTIGQTIVLAHLRHPTLTDPTRDENLQSDFVKAQK